MQEYVIVNEFRKIFESRRAEETRMAIRRRERAGRLDGRLASRTVHGDGRVFRRREPVTVSGVAGSFALCTTLQDLDDYNELGFIPRPQVRLWETAVRSLFAAARSVGIPCRIFAGNRSWSRDGLDLREYDDVEAFFRDKGVNSWLRQKETIRRAEAWHREVNARGEKLTLLVTMWPEIRDPATNRDPERYRRFLDEMARDIPTWTRESHFYALGIQLEKTAARTWGEYRRFGVHNHFRACFPNASRFELEQPEDLAPILRTIAQKMAKLQR